MTDGTSYSRGRSVLTVVLCLMVLASLATYILFQRPDIWHHRDPSDYAKLLDAREFSAVGRELYWASAKEQAKAVPVLVRHVDSPEVRGLLVDLARSQHRIVAIAILQKIDAVPASTQAEIRRTFRSNEDEFIRELADYPATREGRGLESM